MTTQPTTRTFHCTEAGSSKFWTIVTAADGKSLTVTFGKIGTAGQSKEKSFPAAEACAKEAAKLIREKTGKGYIEQGAPATPAPQPPAAPAKSAVPAPAATAAKTKFLKADYKAAAKALFTLDPAAIDGVIASGIPLDEPKFAPTASFTEDTAIGALLDCASSYHISNPDKAAHSRKVDDAILRLADAGATIPAGRARNIAFSHLFKTLDRLLGAGLDINTAGENGRPLLGGHLMRDPEVVAQLLARGADPRKAPGLLHTVAQFGPHTLLKTLVETHKLPLDEIHEDQTPAEAADEYYQKITTNNLPIAEACAHNPKLRELRDNTGKLPSQQVAFYREQTLNRNCLLALEKKNAPAKPAAPAPQKTAAAAPATLPSSPPAPMPSIDPLAGTTTVAKAAPAKRFTKAQGKAAHETFLSLDRAAIDAVIATGIPLDENIFGPKSLYPAVSGLVTHVYAQVRFEPITIGQIDAFDAVIMQLLANGADPMKYKNEIAFSAYANLPRTLTHLLQKHLAAGYKINTPDNYGQPLINRACYHHRTAEILIAAGLDTTAGHGFPFLAHAAIHYPHDTFRRLIETHKVPADTTGTGGNTPLEAAEEHIAKKPGKISADAEKNINYLRALAQKNSASASSSATTGNPDADRRLLNACKQRELDNTSVISRALKEGANPNARDAEGRTPLHCLAGAHYPHIIEQGIALLIPAGADPHALDNEGRTPLFHFFTGYSGSTAAARALVNSGVDPKHKDKHGRNALAHMLATAPVEEDHDARHTTLDMLRTGVPATDCDAHGNTALHLMVTQQDLGGEAGALVKLAITKGNDVNARNTAGHTPLHAAVMRPKDDRHTFFDYLIKELLRNKAGINAQDPAGNTAIHLCADPDEDLSELIAGNPDLALANKAGVTVLQHIKNLGYHNAGRHTRLTKAIDALIAEPASARSLPPLDWKPHPIDLAAPPPAQLRIVSSFHIQDNAAAADLVHIGANRLAITGNIPSDVTVFDTALGKVIWTLDSCDDGAGSVASDDYAVYVARENGGSRFVTAHKHDTGEELWKCGMSTSYKQFGTRFVCTPNYVVHASQSAGKFYPVHKKTGKKYIAPLINPYPQRRAGNKDDWGAWHGQPYWRTRSLIACGDTLLVLGVKPKTHIIALDQYDLAKKGAHMRTIVELPEDSLPLGHHIRGDALHIFTTDGHLRKIDIPSGKITADHDHCPKIEHDFDTFSLTVSGDKLIYILASECGEYRAHHIYDLATGKLIATTALKKELPFAIHKPSADGKRIYCFGRHGSTGRDIAIHDLAAQDPAAGSGLKLPNYGGYDWAEQRLVLGDAIYIAQKGGLENNEDTCVLHRIQ